MSTQFAADLRLARRKAGYTQGDVAHLLSSHQSVVSELEKGLRTPTLEQIIELSMIYGRSFESFFGTLMCACQKTLMARLERLPELKTQLSHTFHRDKSLQRLQRRLASQIHYGGA